MMMVWVLMVVVVKLLRLLIEMQILRRVAWYRWRLHLLSLCGGCMRLQRTMHDYDAPLLAAGAVSSPTR